MLTPMAPAVKITSKICNLWSFICFDIGFLERRTGEKSHSFPEEKEKVFALDNDEVTMCCSLRRHPVVDTYRLDMNR